MTTPGDSTTSPPASSPPTDTPAPRPEAPRRSPRIEDFVGEPTRDLEDWRWLWTTDQPFPIRSQRGLLGSLLVAGRKLLRPLVRAATGDLWDRQRVWNLIVLEHLAEIRRDVKRIEEERVAGLEARMAPVEHKTAHLEAFLEEGLEELMRYDDALYSRVDQKLDRYRREANELAALLGSALDRAGSQRGSGTAASAGGEARAAAGDTTPGALRAAMADRHYLELERRHRGTPAEIRERLSIYLPLFTGKRDVVDLGCGRGEALALLREHGLEAAGVDESAEMVRRCREQGLDAAVGEALGFLAARPAASLDGVVSFHVVEHLPPAVLQPLVREAWRVLRDDGVLVLETPNPLSITVAASGFWRDPSHLRPLHPDALRLLAEQAGFESVEIRWLHPFADADRLPEIDLAGLDAEGQQLAHRVNRLRDRLDQALYGYQDYALIARKR